MKVLLEKEYYELSKDEPTIGLLMMVKNEEKRIRISLDSMIDKKTRYVDAVIIYDTGSTDNTLKIIEEFCEEHKINLYMIQGEFVDFSTSRNVSLEYADTKNVHYLLLLDCNDELKGGEHLRRFAKEMFSKLNSAFLTCQQWWSGSLDKYYNVRFLKARCGWRYFGSVHEWIKDTTTDGPNPRYSIIRMPDNIILYQDRTKDDDKTSKRFVRDRELLLKDYQKNPQDSRTLFYLGQTCHCLKLYSEALYYSKLRLELEGFDEEKFHSYMRCGNCTLLLKHSWSDSMSWYLKAYEHSQRAEPLIKIADYYRYMAEKYKKPGLWRVAYMYAREACELPFPHESILFIDNGVYDYYRWHLMGIIGFYVNKHDEGRNACLKAIQNGTNKEADEKNLQFYKKEETQNEFIQRTIKELSQKYPKLDAKSIRNRANKMWNDK